MNDQVDPTPQPQQPSSEATYNVRVTLRNVGGHGPTNADIEDAVTAAVNEITPAGVIVTARSERTDR